MPSSSAGRRQRLIAAACLVGGVLLTVIGIRYFLVPQSAARTFGVPGRPAGFELHYVVGLRNVWLGLLAIAFAALREWRALALWLAAATVVCLADAFIVATSTGGVPQMSFHLACGIASAVLAALCWQLARKAGRPAAGCSLRGG
jgi:hypothetical protein